MQSFVVLLCAFLFSAGKTPAAATPVANASARNATSRNAAADSAETHERLLLSISEFHAAWQSAWRESENFRKRRKPAQLAARKRLPFVHCHNDGRDFGAENGVVGVSNLRADSIVRLEYKLVEVTSGVSRYAVCPSWLLGAVETAEDESLGRDGALIDTLREPIHALRAKLVAQLDTAATLWPGDGWLTGQRTRLHIDQYDLEAALAAIASCKGEAWWCSALLGYTYARAGQSWLAESAFVKMRAAMPVPKRCEWEDLSNLLSPLDRKPYAALSCEARLVTNARIWWLADPLFRTRANERLVEHDVRRVEISLRKDVLQDERYTWIDKDGGGVLSQMIERYGWPVYTAWGGFAEDTNHTSYLDGFSSPPMAPYTTFEYSLDRVHTIPSWQSITDPFAITESSWLLRGETAEGEAATNWWPDEHFRPDRLLVQLPDGQTAMFRRQSQSVVAVAVQLNHPELARAKSAAFDAMLLTTTRPGQVDSLAQVAGQYGSTIVLRGLTNPLPRIMAVEAQSVGKVAIDARSRFGATPPPPLDSMKRGDIAVSDPALLRVDAETVLPPPGEDLLDRMLGTVHLNAGKRRVGLYWETYGLSATDTVKVYVRVAADQQISAMRRLGMSLNVASNPNSAIVQQWTEPDAQRGTRTLDGPIPVQMRTIMLNLSQLQPGPYVLEVGVERKGGTLATGQRKIFIEP